MLCRVCELLIRQHGLAGAEKQMRQNPTLWRDMLIKAQTPSMLAVYDVIADSLMENALHFFRNRIEDAFNSRNYTGCLGGERSRRGSNDTIYARLDRLFTFEQAMRQMVAVKGVGVTHNSVRQMLKNWCKQGLADRIQNQNYKKLK